MNEVSADHKVRSRIIAQLAGQDTGGLLLLHQRVTVNNFECVLINDQEREHLNTVISDNKQFSCDYLLLHPVLRVTSGLTRPHQAAQAGAGAGGHCLGAGALSAGLQTHLCVDIKPKM